VFAVAIAGTPERHVQPSASGLQLPGFSGGYLVVDQLIQDIIHNGTQATAADIRSIVERMGSAPFDQRQIDVPTRERGREFDGHALDAWADALVLHVFRRITEEQWLPELDSATYFADLMAAVNHPSARLVVSATMDVMSNG